MEVSLTSPLSLQSRTCILAEEQLLVGQHISVDKAYSHTRLSERGS